MAAPPDKPPPPSGDILNTLPTSALATPTPVAKHNAWAKSFSSLLKSPEKASIPVREPSSFKGKPELCISRSEQSILCADMPFVLIGKFSHGKPSIDVIRKFFLNLGLRGYYNISVLDAKHIAIECDLEEDYTRLFSRQGIQIQQYHMRLTKWTPDFRPGVESPLVPVWVLFPLLPLYWFSKDKLFHVDRLVGRPLRVDEPTIQRKRLGVARVCIEVDVSKPLPEEIILTVVNDITREPEERITQSVLYEKVPSYCAHCFHLGHDKKFCKVLHTDDHTKLPEIEDKATSHHLGHNNNNGKAKSSDAIEKLSDMEKDKSLMMEENLQTRNVKTTQGANHTAPPRREIQVYRPKETKQQHNNAEPSNAFQAMKNGEIDPTATMRESEANTYPVTDSAKIVLATNLPMIVTAAEIVTRRDTAGSAFQESQANTLMLP